MTLDQTPPKRASHSRSSSLMQFAYNDKRLKLGLKNALKKFPTLHKKKPSLVLAAATQASLEPAKEEKVEEAEPVDTDMKREESKPSTPKQSEPDPAPVTPVGPGPIAEMAAILRSRDNEELIKLLEVQTEERDRFVIFEKEGLDTLQKNHHRVQEERRSQHVQAEKENMDQVRPQCR